MSESRQPLVPGDHLRDPEHAPSTFVTHVPPVVFHNSIIVAAAHPNLYTGHQIRDGWFLSDFYAFNDLLKGVCEDQTWLSNVVSI